GRNRQADASLGGSGKPIALYFAPALAAIGALPERTARATTLQRIGLAHALPARCIEHLGIARIHRDINEPRFVADKLAERPRLAAVLRHVEPAIGIGSP